MAFLTKLTVTRHIDPKTKARVPANTPGAKKVKEKTDCYYIVDKSGGGVKRINTECTDKRAALAVLNKYHTALERGEQGLSDPLKPHLDRAASEHVSEYIQVVRERGRSAEYIAKLERELTNILKAARVNQLRDLTADRVSEYLSGLKVKGRTRNKHRSYLFSFCEWLVKRDRLAVNPIAKVETVKRQEGKRQRRSLRPKELRSLVTTVAAYPLAAKSVNKGGRPRQDGSRPAPSVAKLSETTRATLILQGRERRLWYRVALLTGLRRGELSRVQVRHFRAKRKLIDLPGELTKNRKRAIIPLPAALATDLGQWIADTNRKLDAPLFDIPEAATMCLMHKRHLAHAGIPYQTDSGFADWHSMRKSTNTFLRRRGVQLRLRQRFLRHTAADLATTAYDDERLAELKPVVKLLARLDTYLTRPANATTAERADTRKK